MTVGLIVEGGEEARRRAREELRRRQRLDVAKRLGLTEVEPGNLRFARFGGLVTDTMTGEELRIVRGEIDLTDKRATRYWIDAAGNVGFLEPV